MVCGKAQRSAIQLRRVARRREHRLAQPRAVVRQIVAGDHGDAVAAAGERLGEDRGRPAARQIALLGDGERDDPRLRRGDPLDQRRSESTSTSRTAPITRTSVADDQANRARPAAPSRRAPRASAARRRCIAPAEIVEHHRLMRAVEGAEAEMDDARPRGRRSRALAPSPAAAPSVASLSRAVTICRPP